MTKEEALQLVNEDWQNFAELDDEFRKDKEIVLAALESYSRFVSKAKHWTDYPEECNILESVYADESLKKDRDVVLAAVKNDGYALQQVDESFRKDRDVVLAAVEKDWDVFSELDAEFRKDRDVVFAAYSSYIKNQLFKPLSEYDEDDYIDEGSPCGILEYVDESLRKDKFLVLAAVLCNGRELEFADESMKKDKRIVLAAMANDHPWYFEYADESLKKDKEFILSVIRSGNLDHMQVSGLLKFVDKSLRYDREIIEAVNRKCQD